MQKTFESSMDYNKVLNFAKKFHRTEKGFYIVNCPPYNEIFSNISETEFALHYKNFNGFAEHWKFNTENNRWKKED